MGERTAIAWCDATANFWWGCAEVSPGCDNCYAKMLAARLKGITWGFGALHPRLQIAGVHAMAYKLQRRAVATGVRLRVFTNSMSDFFDNHADVPTWRATAWDTIRACTALDWLILTKRPQNITAMLPPGWGTGWRHVWLGVSAESQREYDRRWPELAAVPNVLPWVSAEPLLEPVQFVAPGARYPAWVVVGGESGADRRDCGEDAIIETAAWCRQYGIPVFVKQDSAAKPDQQGRIPDEHFVRQWPRSPAAAYRV